MFLIHRLKGKNYHQIPLDTNTALLPESFATYSQQKAGEITHLHAGWTFRSLHDGKYKEHTFELCIEAGELERVIRFLETARERFAKPGIE